MEEINDPEIYGGRKMIKYLLPVLSVLLLILIGIITMKQIQKTKENSDTLCILWTSDDPDVAIKMVFMYANAAKKNKWFDEVELIIWGPSSKLTSENTEIQETLANIMEAGVIIKACKACADQYGVSDKLESLGIEVKYMGEPLTRILKSNKKLLTF